mgnify:CR=1 FL=1
MARLFASASSQRFDKDVGIVTEAPFTMMCWFMALDVTSAFVLMWLGDKDAAADFFTLSAAGHVAGDPVRATARNGGTSFAAATTTGYTANVWYHAAGAWASSASRAAYINGGSKGTETTNVVPAGVDRFRIGGNGDSSPDDYFNGRLAACKMWRAALTQEEVQMEMRQYLPVRLNGFIGLWPFTNGYVGNDSTGLHMLASTGTGTPTPIEGPPIPWGYMSRHRHDSVAAIVASPSWSSLTLLGVQ